MFVWVVQLWGLKKYRIFRPAEDNDGDEGCNRMLCAVYLAVNNEQSKALKVPRSRDL